MRVISEANILQHWSKGYKRKKNQQNETLIEMSKILRGRKIRLPCLVKLTRIGPKKLDKRDNLPRAFKAVVDAIAQKLGVDDGDEDKVDWVYDQEVVGKRRYAVRIEINSTAPGALPL